MPGIPPALREWLTLLTQPAVILIRVGLIVNQQNRRVDELHEDNKELGRKLDRLIESRLPTFPLPFAEGYVTPSRFAAPRGG